MHVQASLKMRTEGREEIRVRRKGVRAIINKTNSRRGGRLKTRAPIPRKRLLRNKFKTKF